MAGGGTRDTACHQPYGVAFDGKAVWVTCSGDGYAIKE